MFSNQALIIGHTVPEDIRGKSKQKLDHTFIQTCQSEHKRRKLNFSMTMYKCIEVEHLSTL